MLFRSTDQGEARFTFAIAIPSLEKLSKEEDGRQKIEQITRYVGVGLALVQSFGIIVTYVGSRRTGVLPSSPPTYPVHAIPDPSIRLT